MWRLHVAGLPAIVSPSPVSFFLFPRFDGFQP
jgi:hypothetical protein